MMLTEKGKTQVGQPRGWCGE